MVSDIYGENGDYDKKIEFLNKYVDNDRFGKGMQMRLSRELANAWILKGNAPLWTAAGTRSMSF